MENFDKNMNKDMAELEILMNSIKPEELYALIFADPKTALSVEEKHGEGEAKEYFRLKKLAHDVVLDLLYFKHYHHRPLTY